MLRLFSQTLIYFFSVFILLSALPALSDDWHTIGSASLRPSNEMVSIPVRADFQNQSFHSLRLHALDANIRIQTVKLIFHDGESVRLNIQKKVLSGHFSRTVPLEIQDRKIKKIVVFYKMDHDSRGRLEVMAK